MAELEVGGRFGRLYGFLDWPLRVAALNVMWLMGVLAGLVVAGLAPATAALYVVLRDYFENRSPRPWGDFWRYWRSGLVSSQPVLGIPLVTSWVVFFYTLATRGTPLVFGMTVLALGYAATLLLLPAALAHLDLPATQTWKATVVLAWRQPVPTLVTAVTSILAAAVAWFTMPAAIPLFFPALPALLGTLTVRRALSAKRRS